MTKINYQPQSDLEKFGMKVYSALVENFPQTFFVGGMVRDMLLERKITDIDIATAARPNDVVKILNAANIETDDKARYFGVIVAKKKQLSVEIATLRKDSYDGSRYPKIRFISSAKQDSKRRDFTINSLYFLPGSGKILDFYQGALDINRRVLRLIGNPQKRIKEDPLRALRALRFALSLNFNIEQKTFSAVKNNFHLLKTVSPTRIQTDLKKVKNKKNKNIILKVINSPKTLDKFFK